MAVDGPFADVSSLSDDVPIDGESFYSQPSIISRHSSPSQGSAYSDAYSSTYSGSHKSAYSGHAYSASSYSGSLRNTANYSSVRAKRRSPPLVAPRQNNHGSLKRLDRLPPPYARPTSAGQQDESLESQFSKSRSVNVNGETFTSKLTVIPDSNCNQHWSARSPSQPATPVLYQKPFSPKSKEPWSTNRRQQPLSLVAEPVSRFDEHVYEDPQVCQGPPRLPPESGMLSKNQTKVILRPLAFKPVMQPMKPAAEALVAPNGDEGYYSTEFRNRGDYSDPYRPREELRHDSRPGSFNSSGHSRMSSGHTETYMTTPSPSDSGVGELEAILREKDAEISHLRETMDGNERAIFQVFEEKKHAWHQQMDKMIQEYEEKIRLEKQKSFKSEQSLLMQIVKLQQDKKALNNDLESSNNQLKEMENRCTTREREVTQAKSRGEESNWALHQKTGELTMCKSQLRDSKDESQQRYVEIANLRSKLCRCESELTETKSQLNKLRQTVDEGKRQLKRSCQELDRLGLDKNQSFELCPGDRMANCDSDDENANSAFQQQEMKRVKNELEKIKSQKYQLQQEFQEERSQWLDEKNKVICYQKQLQLNYVQMLRKNKTLEGDVEQLMLDLERNDLKASDSNC